MDGPSALTTCLVELDVKGIRQLWHLIAPQMPQPKDDADALATMHYARTLMGSLSSRQRFYSHRWLLDHNMLSGLPDELKPSAERMYPKTVSAVGLSVNSRSDWLKPAVPLIRGAMETAIQEAYADGKADDVKFIKRRMAEAKTVATRKLFGRKGESNG
jgi:hypothetical protein